MKTLEKIKQLETWLIDNPDHPDRHLVWQDKNQLQLQSKKDNEQ